MIFPIESLVSEQYELGLVVAVAIGFLFGFVLERAGFGRATTLSAQFYGTDMTVFKVMFGAIVTAMIGVVIASGLGLLDFKALSESAVSNTYIVPMLVGGLVLGIGFIISGYCPGTSLVAASSGNLDGMMTFVGVTIGSFIYSAIEPSIASFHDSTDMGQLFFYDLFGVPPAVVAVGVTAMAIGMFFLADKLEPVFSRKFLHRDKSLDRRPRLVAFASFSVTAFVGLGLMFVPLGAQKQGPTTKALSISQYEFAKRLLDKPWSMRIIDLRKRDECAKQRIPGAECVPKDKLGELGLEYAPGARDLVLVAAQDLEVLPKPVEKYKGKVFVLQEGFDGWTRFALQDPPVPGADASEADRSLYGFRSALRQALTGAPPPPPPPSGVKKFVPKKRKKGGGCG